jgi:transcriptional regulator with XRE-family HTH domain
MDASLLIRACRRRAGLTLRELGALAGTSHSTLSAYETGSKTPNVRTLERVLDACGFVADASPQRRRRAGIGMSKGDELEAVLHLAEAFPARHSPGLEAPIFPRGSKP